MTEYVISLDKIVIEDAHYMGEGKPSAFCCVLPDKLCSILDATPDIYLDGFAHGKKRFISYISESDASFNSDVRLLGGYFIDDPCLHILNRSSYVKIKLYFG